MWTETPHMSPRINGHMVRPNNMSELTNVRESLNRNTYNPFNQVSPHALGSGLFWNNGVKCNMTGYQLCVPTAPPTPLEISALKCAINLSFPFQWGSHLPVGWKHIPVCPKYRILKVLRAWWWFKRWKLTWQQGVMDPSGIQLSISGRVSCTLYPLGSSGGK